MRSTRTTIGVAPAAAASRAWRSITVRPASGRVARKQARPRPLRDRRRSMRPTPHPLLRSGADARRARVARCKAAWLRRSRRSRRWRRAILRSTTGSPGAPSSASSASATRPLAPKLAARLFRRERRERPIGVAARAAHQIELARGALDEGGRAAPPSARCRCRPRRRARRSGLRDHMPCPTYAPNRVNAPFHRRPRT